MASRWTGPGRHAHTLNAAGPSPGVGNFGPLAPDLEQNWIDLKAAVVHAIYRQIIPKRTFEAARSDFTEGKWRQKDKQLVGEFEGEIATGCSWPPPWHFAVPAEAFHRTVHVHTCYAAH